MAARRPRIRLRLLLVAATGFGVAEIVAGLLPSYLAFALFAPVIGFCTITLLNSANATMQLASAPELRGRVMALYMTVVMGGTPLGSPGHRLDRRAARRPLDADDRRRAGAGRGGAGGVGAGPRQRPGRTLRAAEPVAA